MMTSLYQLPLYQSVSVAVKKFWKNTDATMTVEAALMFPLLTAWLAGSYAFFEAYQNRNKTQKAAYVIGDILSRRTLAVRAGDIDNLKQLYDAMVVTDGGSAIRVSSIRQTESGIEVLWSRGTHSKLPSLQNADVNVPNYSDRIPNMFNGETVLIVETFVDYNADFILGWGHQVFQNFVVASPRVTACVPFDFEDGTIPSC